MSGALLSSRIANFANLQGQRRALSRESNESNYNSIGASVLASYRGIENPLIEPSMSDRVQRTSQIPLHGKLMRDGRDVNGDP
jgi:hypothetical protein